MKISEIAVEYLLPLNKNPLWQVLRWIAVLPVPLFIIFIVHLIIHSPLVVISSPDGIGERLLFSLIPIQLIENLLAAFYAPFLLLSVGAVVAPKFKLQTAYVLICLWGIVFVFGIAQFLINRSSNGWEWITFGTTLVLSILGTFIGYSEARKQHEESVCIKPEVKDC